MITGDHLYVQSCCVNKANVHTNKLVHLDANRLVLVLVLVHNSCLTEEKTRKEEWLIWG